ncbi:MAG: hypothetical protein J5I92_13445 [Thiogranum sp.]|nr:hypothetical protein [Thiogranum sp.]
MSKRLMVLPAKDPGAIRLVRVPDDFESQELFRHVTGLIAQLEQDNPDYSPDDIVALLEDNGFEPVDFVLGPALD